MAEDISNNNGENRDRKWLARHSTKQGAFEYLLERVTNVYDCHAGVLELEGDSSDFPFYNWVYVVKMVMGPKKILEAINNNSNLELKLEEYQNGKNSNAILINDNGNNDLRFPIESNSMIRYVADSGFSYEGGQKNLFTEVDRNLIRLLGGNPENDDFSLLTLKGSEGIVVGMVYLPKSDDKFKTDELRTDVGERLGRLRLDGRYVSAKALAQVQKDTAQVIHDFKSPIAEGVGYLNEVVDILNGSNPDLVLVRERLKYVQDSFEKLKGRTGNILQLSKEDMPKFSRFDAHNKLDIYGIHTKRYVLKGGNYCNVELRIPNVPAYIYADEEHFRRVMFNLLENACDAEHISFQDREPGLKFLEVWTDTNHKTGYHLTHIRNSKYIPPEYQRELFRPGFTTKGSQGNGFGLANARKLVELNHGYINFDTTPEKGTTFTVGFRLAS